jgi:hypothetical protein
MTQCLLDRPAAQAWPTTREWITDFLNAEGDHWDGEAAIAMTSEALFSALAYADRPVRMAARRDGKAAQVSVYAHTSTLPQTEWTAVSPGRGPASPTRSPNPGLRRRGPDHPRRCADGDLVHAATQGPRHWSTAHQVLTISWLGRLGSPGRLYAAMRTSRLRIRGVGLRHQTAALVDRLLLGTTPGATSALCRPSCWFRGCSCSPPAG